MIHPDDVAAWLAEVRQNPEAAPGIIEALVARLVELDAQNEALRDALVRLRQERGAGADADRVSELSRRVQTLESRLARNARFAPEETAQAMLVFTLDGRAARVPLPVEQDLTLVASHLRPRHLLVATDDDALLLFTDKGRAVRLRVTDVAEAEAPVRYLSLLPDLVLDLDESLTLVVALPPVFDRFTLVTRKGFARSFRRVEVDSFLERGLPLHSSPVDGDYPAYALLGDGRSEMLVVTQSGKGVRFPARVVGVQPTPVIKLERGDVVAGTMVVDDEASVTLVSAGGLAARREMSGFGAHATAGNRGKLLTRLSDLVAAVPARDADTLWLLTAAGRLLAVPADRISSGPGASGGKPIAQLGEERLISLAVHKGAQH